MIGGGTTIDDGHLSTDPTMTGTKTDARITGTIRIGETEGKTATEIGEMTTGITQTGTETEPGKT